MYARTPARESARLSSGGHFQLTAVDFQTGAAFSGHGPQGQDGRNQPLEEHSEEGQQLRRAGVSVLRVLGLGPFSLIKIDLIPVSSF